MKALETSKPEYILDNEMLAGFAFNLCIGYSIFRVPWLFSEWALPIKVGTV